MKRLLTINLLIAVLVITGCATVTPRAAGVRVTDNREIIQGCKYIGEVMGADEWDGGSLGRHPRAAEINAHNRLRVNAAEMGANTVLLMSDKATREPPLAGRRA